jgi:hypothetical protein
VTVLLIGSVLLGAVLGRLFKFPVLLPACAFVLVVVFVSSSYVEHGLLRSFFEFAVLTTSLQIAYVLAMLSRPTIRKAAPCAPGKSTSTTSWTRS